MGKKVLICFILLLFLAEWALAEKGSLSDVFLLGKGIQDSDGDNFGDKVNLRIIIPDHPSAHEIAVAADIAARAGLESLVLDFGLIIRESEMAALESNVPPLFVGRNLKLFPDLAKKAKIDLGSFQPHQGLVSLVSLENGKGILLLGGSKESLLRTGRAFFLRWPYLWDIWGREDGETYFSLEEDLAKFLSDREVCFEGVTFQAAAYEFPDFKSRGTLKRLKFNNGEIKNLTLRIDFPDAENQEKALKALELLRIQHRRGENTDILSYSGVAQILFELFFQKKESQVILPRVGFPKRILTPSFKAPTKPKIKGKDFDLLNLFTKQGFYTDSNQDQILDTLDTSMILPQNSGFLGAARLASRLVLESAGSSFPIVYLDEEIEDSQSLVSPIIIGSTNRLNRELVKTGKLRIPDLQAGWGVAQVVPDAFNSSNAMSIAGKDKIGVEKILDFLSRTFPYLDDYQEGRARIHDLLPALEEYLSGKRGSAEAYFFERIEKFIEENRDKDFASFKIEFLLPTKNEDYENHIHELLHSCLNIQNLETEISTLDESRLIFKKEKEFIWEADEALGMIQEKIKTIGPSDEKLRISLGVSESPELRKKIKRRIEKILGQNRRQPFEVDVFSSYKQGFFWILERVLPRLKGKCVHHLIIRFAEEKDDFSVPKRFYTEPSRWLQELYPVDEFLCQNLGIPLERIEFEMKKTKDPVYEVLAYDEKNKLLFKEGFSPRVREMDFLNILPEWGKVKVTTGWLKITFGEKTVLDVPLESDLERFWEFYQEEILPQVYSYIMKKTGNEPTFSKQPYFKRLLVELWFSEPDFRLGLDEEMVSSLEALHDEIYFDTLDFLRGITEVKIEDEESLPEDMSRYSAPGNILPLLHPSLEGRGGKVRISFEDWKARLPEMYLHWEEKGEKYDKKIVFPRIKPKSLRIPLLIYNGTEDCIESITAEVKIEKKKEYLQLIDILESFRKLHEKGVLPAPFRFPKLKNVILNLECKEIKKEVSLPVSFPEEPEREAPSVRQEEKSIVPTDKIISPEMCLDIVDRLSRLNSIKSYIAGISYERRKVPVLEIMLPQEKYISVARLITFKPTLYVSGRQHANEVCATNTILKLAEQLAREKPYDEYVKKMNFVLHPMENPDGAELAYRLQKMTPFHSLHAGRYSALGIDVGYQVGASRPLLPEAKVRKRLYSKWLPDIHLNLHGYPSHEWVQPFSHYSPYLFRDYWIPRGWFAYLRGLTHPLYEIWRKASEELRSFIQKEMKKEERISASNKRFYDRYFRWASRWQPHLSYLELYDGLNLYAKRRSSRESKLTTRRRVTFIEETPELMDETAHGRWLDFLCSQGLTYLKAHMEYLARARHKIGRIEEEIRDRIRIQFIRIRPPALPSESGFHDEKK